MTRLVRGEQFEAKFRQFHSSVFRLETLQEYRGSGEDAAIAAFCAGDRVPPPDPEQVAWEAMIRANRRAGRLMQRVHVVVEPVTDYMRFELTWAYAPNAAAGEDIRVVPVADVWPDGVPHRDFWLFDDAQLYLAHYEPDGTWLGVEPVDDREQVSTARRWRAHAVQQSVEWSQYLQRHPDLLARVIAAGFGRG